MIRTRVTIRDVAAVAGVSHQTVSRVINNSDAVRPETRARVQAAIEHLGFRPDAIARSMASGRTGNLACFSPNLTDYTFASIIDGAEREARRHGYYLMSASAPDAGTFALVVDQLIATRSPTSDTTSCRLTSRRFSPGRGRARNRPTRSHLMT